MTPDTRHTLRQTLRRSVGDKDTILAPDSRVIAIAQMQPGQHTLTRWKANYRRLKIYPSGSDDDGLPRNIHTEYYTAQGVKLAQ